MSIIKKDYGVSVIADTNIFTIPFTSGYPLKDYSIVYLWITLQNDGVLTLVRTNGEDEYEEILNNGCTIPANTAFMTTIMLSEETLNLKFSTDTTVSYYQMREMY